MNDESDLPILHNYEGITFNLEDVIGQVVKDADGEFVPKHYVNIRDDYMDVKARKINKKGYLIDKLGNVIDNRGRVIFKKQHLIYDEIPKLFDFIVDPFDEDNTRGEFALDSKGKPVIRKDKSGVLIDDKGRRVN